MIHGFESIWVREIIRYTSCNDTESLIDFINNHSDYQLINVRADLKEYIGRYNSIGNLWSTLSIYVAIVIFALPYMVSKLSDRYVDIFSFIIGLLTVPMVIGFFVLTRPHRIGAYHRALSMLEDYCRMLHRLEWDN